MHFPDGVLANMIFSPWTSLAYAMLWASLTLIIYTYIGYPLLLRILAHAVNRRSVLPSENPSISIIICAHNEAAHIHTKLNDTLALNYPPHKLQIIVASDGSSDETNAIVQSFGARGVRLLQIVRQAGKTSAQNIAATIASGDILVFSDATARYDPNALRYLAGNYADPQIGACSGRYIYVGQGGTPASGTGAHAFGSYDNQIRALQSRVWSLTGCCGCIYSIRRALYTPLESHIISDLVQPLHVLRQGFRVTFEPRALAWEETAVSTHQEFSMRVRVVARALRGFMSVPELLKPWRSPWISFQIWSHKLLRWSIPFLLIILLASSAFLSPSSRPIFILLELQIAFYAISLLAMLFYFPHRWRILRIPLYFCTINAAAVVGLLQFLRGNRYIVWNTVRESSHAN